MGVLQRFERRLEGLVEGAFARVFGGAVQPVEVAAALQREAQNNKSIVGQGRVLVPNRYVVELGPSDAPRLLEYDTALRRELAAVLSEHAHEQGWSFVGTVDVRFEEVPDLGTGIFRVRSAARPDEPVAVRSPQPSRGWNPRLVLQSTGGEVTGVIRQQGAQRVVELARPVTLLGRGAEADVQVADTAVSRRHAELHLTGDSVELVDLGSTNGTQVNGQRVDRTVLRDGDRLQVGTSTFVFSRDGAR